MSELERLPNGCFFDKVRNIKHEPPMSFCLFLFDLCSHESQSSAAESNTEKSFVKLTKMNSRVKMFETVYTCTDCPKISISESLLRHHRRRIHKHFSTDSSDSFNGDGDEENYFQGALKIEKSSDDEPKAKLSTVYQTRHMLSLKSSGSKFNLTCSFCRLNFNHNITLRRHIDYEHEPGEQKDKNYRCRKCASGFNFKGNIGKHYRMKHNFCFFDTTFNRRKVKKKPKSQE